MNKTEMIDHIAKSADISKAAAQRALDATVASIKMALKKDSMVTLVGFGTFYVGKRRARTGRDPRTQAPINTHRFPTRNVPISRLSRDSRGFTWKSFRSVAIAGRPSTKVCTIRL